MFGLFGSITTLAIEYDDWLSKMGLHVVPALVVFQTPPDATATYQVFGSVGWTAMSLIRPDVNAGPIARNRNPPSAPAAPPRAESPGVVSRPAVERGGAPRCWAMREDETTATVNRMRSEVIGAERPGDESLEAGGWRLEAGG